MDIKKFIKEINNIKPSREELTESYNLSHEEATELLKSFEIKLDSSCKWTYSLFQLCFCCEHNIYEATNIDIMNEIKEIESYEDEKYLLFGTLDIDWLVITEEEEIVLINPDNNFEIIYPIADSSSSFLRVLLLLFDFSYKNLDEEKLAQWTINKIDNCVDLAGGEKYRSFYQFYYN